MFNETTEASGTPPEKGTSATADEVADIEKPEGFLKQVAGFFSRDKGRSPEGANGVRELTVRKKHTFKKRRVSKRLLEAIRTSAKARRKVKRQSSDEALVMEYVAVQRKNNPSWDPETSTLGDGEKTFGEYWRAEPRDYKHLAAIVRRVLSLTR